MGSNHSINPRRATGLIMAAGALTLTACAGSDDSDSAVDETVLMEAADMPDTLDAVADADIGGEGASGEIAATEAPASGADIPATPDYGVIGRDVIVEMRVVVSSDDIERTVSSIMGTTASLGGGVASSDVDYGTEDAPDDGHAVLVVKVPPESIDRLLDGLDDSGTVESINQNARDVTEQLVDLDVRIENARQSVTNVREFMDRAEDLTDLVALEGELTRRQTELEQLEAQQRNLSDRVAMSTVTIEVLPTDTLPADDEPGGLGDAFRSGFEAFAAVLFGIALVLAVLTPFLAVGVVVLLIGWLAVRGRRAGRGRPDTGTRAHDHPGEVSDDELVSASHEG